MSGKAERIGWAVRYSDGSTIAAGTQPGVEAIAARLAFGQTWELMERWIAPEGYVESLEAENRELRGVVEKYGDDPDYARSRFRQIDLMVDQRAHDRLKIQSLEADRDRYRDLADRLLRCEHRRPPRPEPRREP